MALVTSGWAGASARDAEPGRDGCTREGFDFEDGFARVLAGIASLVAVPPWLDVTAGPGIVLGTASCPSSTDGRSFDCAAAANVVCARMGYGSGTILDTTTRRICRAGPVADIVRGEGLDCRSKPTVTKALCW